jgi:enoyl-CoA hydratase/carnithine racemase
LRVPVIAAVEGGAVGLGWSLALACDLVVAASDAFFSAPFVARGVVPDGGAGWFLVARVGRQRASELLLTDRRLTADEARQFGLVNLVCEPAQAEASALKLADSVVAADPAAIEMTKRLLSACETLDFDAYLAAEVSMATLAQLAKHDSG